MIRHIAKLDMSSEVKLRAGSTARTVYAIFLNVPRSTDLVRQTRGYSSGKFATPTPLPSVSLIIANLVSDLGPHPLQHFNNIGTSEVESHVGHHLIMHESIA